MNMLVEVQTSTTARAVAAALRAAMEKRGDGLDALAGVEKQKQRGPELLRQCFGQISTFQWMLCWNARLRSRQSL